MIEYRDDVLDLPAEALAGFFVDWPDPPSPERHLELLRRSAHVVFAFDGDRVVGFVNAISDGVLSAYVPLLEVLPDYRGRGIGSELMRRLLERVGHVYMVDVTCDEVLVPFYERLGLRPVGVAMGVRNREGVRARRTKTAVSFDDVIVVDWSAASKPTRGANSIWIGHADESDRAPLNVPTRGQASRAVRDLLVDLVGRGRRVLISFDFPYGYPRGTAARLMLGDESPPWLAVWNELSRLVIDGATNANNRYEVAAALNSRGACYWGRPASVGAEVPSRKPTLGLTEFRATELRLRAQRKYVHSTWQLAGAGSVGSQALVGIPVVRALRFDERLADVSAVWPFETGFILPHDVAVVHAEIWPGVVTSVPTAHEIADARQVMTLARYLRDLELDELETLFAAGKGDDAAEIEEGWILGSV